MCTNNNLISTCNKLLIATIASLSIIGFGLVVDSDGLEDISYPFSTVEAIYSNTEGFVISPEGVIESNSSPNYHQPQVTGGDDHHHEPDREVVDRITAELTGYSSTIDQTNSEPFITASGARVRDGVVAANFLEFGTEIRIPEYYDDKVFVVKDRMNRRYSQPKNGTYDGYIDIWFSSRSEANNFGRVRGEVEVLN